jgi:hypothetical protein
MTTAFSIVDDQPRPGYFRVEAGGAAASTDQLELFAQLHRFLAELPVVDQPPPLMRGVLGQARFIADQALVVGALSARVAIEQLANLRSFALQIARSESAGAFVVDDPQVTEDGFSLDLVMKPRGRMVVPKDQQQLSVLIERVLTVLRVLYRPRSPTGGRLGKLFRWAFDHNYRNGSGVIDPRGIDYCIQLVGIAKVGLASDPAQVALATLQLDELRTQIVAREAASIKNGYMRRLLLWVGASVSLLLFLYAVVPDAWLAPSGNAPSYHSLFLILAAACFGAWLSFGTRKVIIGFDDLAALEDDRLDPPLRLVFVGGLTAFIILLFTTKVVAVSIGGLQVDDTNILKSIPVGILVGLICGLSEQVLATAVGKRASELVGAIGAAGAGKTP